MDYQSTIDFLFSQLAVYHKSGPGAYKPGLDTTRALDRAFGSPAGRLRVIHVAGTNGKGSTSHSLAAVLQAAGYRTGLYTSPHLLDFRERIRIDGEMIPRSGVTGFVDRYMADPALTRLNPSFFELTTIMAFDWFARSGVDVAVVETGLGGRLDSTNIVAPLMSVITNISLDHTAMLGPTVEDIAAEKAGIIKHGAEAVVGEAPGGVRRVFEEKAQREDTPLTFACDRLPYTDYEMLSDSIRYTGTPFGTVTCDLTGSYQPSNMATVLAALGRLRYSGLLPFTDGDVCRGLASVARSTGLTGRWTTLSTHPTLICDTGHNIGGWEYLAPRLSAIPGHKEIIIGFVNDKDVGAVMALASSISDASFHFVRASVERALDPAILAATAASYGIEGTVHDSVSLAYDSVMASVSPGDTVFVGGSTFVVADLLALLRRRDLF